MRRYVALLCLITVVVVGCRGLTTSRGENDRRIDQSYMEKDAKPADGTLINTAASGTSASGTQPKLDVALERQIIYTADIRIEVEDFAKAADRVRSVVESAGGFVANSQVSRDNSERESGTLSIRVPKARFNDVLNDLKALGKVKDEGLHGQDVTEEYTDLEARLGNAKRLETRLLELLDRESKSLKDMLEVERELARVREELGRFEGRKRFLDDRLSLATITVTLFEPYAYTSNIFDPLSDAFDRAGTLLIGSLAVLITVTLAVLPWLLVFGLVGYFAGRRVRKWWRKQRGYQS